jgi:tetratricopeptide (TPR) repeat protein
LTGFSRKFSYWIAFLFLTGAIAPDAGAQKKPDRDRSQYNIARQYETIGDLEKALAIYLEILDKNPTNFTYFDAASRCYINLKRYDELVQFIERRLQAEPGNIQFQIRLGEAYLQKDEEEKARQIWNQVLTENPNNASNYRMVANAMLKHRLYDDGIAVYLKGREIMGRQGLFALELAQLHSYRFNYDRATDEYLRYIRANSRQLNYVEARIASFKGSHETYEQVTSVLKNWIAQESGNPIYRKLLISVLLSYENFSAAFAEVKHLEEVKREIKSKEIPGQELFRFSQIALKESRYEFAENALRTIVSNHPDYPDRARVEYELARTLYQQRRFDQALAAFDKVAAAHPGSIWAVESILARGDIFLNEKFSPDSAAQNYHTIVNHFPANKNHIHAYIRLGDVEVARGNLSEAEAHYLHAVQSPTKQGSAAGENRFEGHLRLAELAFYQGDFEKTRKYLKALLEVPSGNLSNEYVNDALELSLLLDQNEQDTFQVLTDYAQAMLLIKQHNLEEAALQLKNLSDSFPSADLAPKAIFQYSRLKRETGDYVSAVLGFNVLIGQYPQNSLCDLALWEIGTIYEEDLREPSKAIESYESILVDYSESVLVENARKKIRSLEAKP